MQKGEAYYNAAGCRSCHRIGHVGSNVGPDLSFVGFRHKPEWLDVWLQAPQAWKPNTKMPDPKLTPSSRKAIVEYMASLKGQMFEAGKKPWMTPEAQKSQALMGKLIYLKIGCVTCHGPGGEGGYPNNNVVGGQIPALRDTVHTYTAQELKEKIKKGAIPVKKDPQGPEPLVRMPAWGEVLSEQEIDAVAAYLFTLKSIQPQEEW